MSNNVTGSVKGTINVAETLGSGIETGLQIPLTLSWRSIFSTSGTLADQCNLIYGNTLTFVASTSQSLDLSNLTDLNNNAIDFTTGRVRFVAFRNQCQTDGSYVTVGGTGEQPVARLPVERVHHHDLLQLDDQRRLVHHHRPEHDGHGRLLDVQDPPADPQRECLQLRRRHRRMQRLTALRAE